MKSKKLYLSLSSCALVGLNLLFPSVVSATIYERVAATWNMQGASHATESKWYTAVRTLVTTDNVEVLALQEAGTPAPAATLMDPLSANPSAGAPVLSNPDGVTTPIEEYRWVVASRRAQHPNRWIYFSRNDNGANRVNVAIVTRERANEVVILPPPARYDSARPILGVRIGADYYFTVHASANAGSDAGAIVNRIYEYFARSGNTRSQWMIMGDFNRPPFIPRPSRPNVLGLSTLLENNYPRAFLSIRVVSQDQATQASGGILDYAVIGQYQGGIRLARHAPANLFVPCLRGQIASDHSPVRFNLTQ